MKVPRHQVNPRRRARFRAHMDKQDNGHRCVTAPGAVT